MLSLLIFVRLVQIRPDWKPEELLAFMPEAIKSMTALPIAGDLVYRVVHAEDQLSAKALATALASEHPGYSAVAIETDCDTSPLTIIEEEELRSLLGDGAHAVDVKHKAMKVIKLHQASEGVSLDVCALLQKEVVRASVHQSREANPRYTTKKVNDHNTMLLERDDALDFKVPQARLLDRLAFLYEKGALDNTCLLAQYTCHESTKGVRANLLREHGHLSPW